MLIMGNKKQKKTASKSKIKPSYILYAVIFIVVSYFIIQYTGYMEIYPKQDIVEIFNITMNGIMTEPFAFLVPNGLGWSGICIFILVFGLILAYIWTVEKRDQHAKGGVNGTAKWVKDKDLPEKWDKHYSCPKDSPFHDGNRNMILTQNVFMSMDTRQTRRNNNVLVIGGSGAGKSRFFVKPNLCEMPLNCNFICTDPSGELLADMGTLLEDAGFKIKVFNLVNMDKSDRYNPMNYIHTETDVILLVDCILANTTDPNKKGGDDFWEKAQKLMFQAFIFLVWMHGDKLRLAKNLSSILYLMDNCQINENGSSDEMNITDQYFAAIKSEGWWFDKNGAFHLGKPNEGDPVDEVFDKIGSDICDKQYTKFKMGAGKTLKSILISAMARLSTLDSQIVADLLSEDDIELNKIGDEKTALFVIIPQEHESFNFLAAMLYTQLFQTLYYHAENECRGNYVVVDGDGENVKIFEIPHTAEDTEDDDDANAVEEEVDFSKNFDIEEKDNGEGKDKKQRKKSLLNNNILPEKSKKKNKGVNSKSSEQKLDEAADKKIDKSKATNESIDKDAIDNNFGKQIEENPEDFEPENEADNEQINEITSTIKAEAEAFCERAQKSAHCVKKGNYYYIKVPAASGNKDEEEIVGKYLHPNFAKKKLEAIKKQCTVTICGLRLPYHVRFLLDEFANIGQIPDFTKKLATMRKYEISATVILQNLAQIKNMYKDDWGSIMGNCDSFLFLGCPEVDTLEYVSKMLGKETIIVRDHSTSKGGKGNSSLSYKQQGRELATADELRRLKDNECIFILRGEQPYKGLKHQYINHPNYEYTADKNENNVYHFKKKKKKSIMTVPTVVSAPTLSSTKNSDGKALYSSESYLPNVKDKSSESYKKYRNEGIMESTTDIYNGRPTVNDMSIAEILNMQQEEGVISNDYMEEITQYIPDAVLAELQAGKTDVQKQNEDSSSGSSSDSSSSNSSESKESTSKKNYYKSDEDENNIDNTFNRFSSSSSDDL